ncbi:MAG: DUF3568 family protein [candidate division NC10 bacterium]|nr:DUF3568 family protein [candidate division NC10 bacterium]
MRKVPTPLRHLLSATFLIAVFVHNQGCAPLLAVGSAVGFGINYYSNNVAERTFTAELPKVWDATLGALDEMAIPVVEKDRGDSQGEIQATTEELKIEIILSAVTPMTTRVKVNAAKPNLLRDLATATEIVERITNQLGKEQARKAVQTAKVGAADPTRHASPASDGPAPEVGRSPGRAVGFVLIRVSAANIRVGASRNSKVLAILPRGARLEKIAESPGWVKVRLSSGAEGFIAQRLVHDPEESSPPALEITKVTLSPIPLAENPGSR